MNKPSVDSTAIVVKAHRRGEKRIPKQTFLSAPCSHQRSASDYRGKG